MYCHFYASAPTHSTPYDGCFSLVIHLLAAHCEIIPGFTAVFLSFTVTCNLKFLPDLFLSALYRSFFMQGRQNSLPTPACVTDIICQEQTNSRTSMTISSSQIHIYPLLSYYSLWHSCLTLHVSVHIPALVQNHSTGLNTPWST